MKRSRVFALRTIIVLAALLAACTRAEPLPSAPPVNLLLVTLDTCRADHMSLYGYERPTTPNIDSFAERAVVFERAYSQSASTIPSLTSLMTSRYVHRHGVLDTFGYRLADDALTLAEILQAAGRQTAAVTGIGILMPNRGLAQGFGHYSFTHNTFVEFWKSAGQLTDEALAWLADNHERPFFLWVHYFEPHRPYRGVPDEFRRRFTKRATSDALLARPGLTSEERSQLKWRIDAYDGALAYADSQVGRLLERVEKLGLLRSTMVVISADHGESLGEHGLYGHRFEIYEPVVHVPLLVFVPGARAGRVKTNVEHVDVLPTVLAELELEAVPDLQGRVLPSVGDSEARSGDAFAETTTPRGHREMINAGRWKLLLSQTPEGERSFALFDLDEDPQELENRIEVEAEIAADLSGRLERWRSDKGSAVQRIDRLEHETDMLRALGYLE